MIITAGFSNVIRRGLVAGVRARTIDGDWDSRVGGQTFEGNGRNHTCGWSKTSRVNIMGHVNGLDRGPF